MLVKAIPQKHAEKNSVFLNIRIHTTGYTSDNQGHESDAIMDTDLPKLHS